MLRSIDIQELIQAGKVVTKSKIDGSFYGFNSESLFPLINGQFWIQNTYYYWYYYAYRPDVSIYNYFRKDYLFIIGLDQFIEVSRVREVHKGTIVNDFRGWSGDTIFKFDNGQVWEQAEYAYSYQYHYRPQAIIYSSGYGFKMQVNGNTVAVKRLR